MKDMEIEETKQEYANWKQEIQQLAKVIDHVEVDDFVQESDYVSGWESNATPIEFVDNVLYPKLLTSEQRV